jgi:hypothetical protein
LRPTKCKGAIGHQNDVIRSLDRDVFDTIDDIPIAQFTPLLVLAMLREIEARGAIELARPVRQAHLRGICLWHHPRDPIPPSNSARCFNRCANDASPPSPISSR